MGVYGYLKIQGSDTVAVQLALALPALRFHGDLGSTEQEPDLICRILNYLGAEVTTVDQVDADGSQIVTYQAVYHGRHREDIDEAFDFLAVNGVGLTATWRNDVDEAWVEESVLGGSMLTYDHFVEVRSLELKQLTADAAALAELRDALTTAPPETRFTVDQILTLLLPAPVPATPATVVS